MPLMLLPFLGSGFVPTDSMPAGCAGSPSTSRSRRSSRRCAGCCSAPPIGNSAALAVAWCAGIALVGYLWAKRLFNRTA